MADQSLPEIIILGAGPLGIEATIYARFLGYRVKLLERSSCVAANVADWGHVQLFTPFSMNASTLGVAAIQSQDPQWQCPTAEALLTGAEFIEQYLRPLAETDLVASSLQTGTEVLAVGKSNWLKNESPGNPERADAEFQVLVRRQKQDQDFEEVLTADIVLDCTGTYGNHNWLSSSGIPAVGEIKAAPHIFYNLPDILGLHRQDFLDKQILVVGAGYSAATVITQLAELANESTTTQATWITRHPDQTNPIQRISEDRLKQRDNLAATANQLATDPTSCITHHHGTTIASILYRESSDDFEVSLEGTHSGTFTFDRIVANVGYHPQNEIYAALQVHECYATGGPMKLAAQLAAQSGNSSDCLDQVSCGPQSLVTTEPNFYILGSKSYGRNSNYLFSIGLNQIRDLFTIIGEREDLDLYQTMPAIAVETK